ncbi:MAG: thioester domain-containing protein, partial [Anaerovoracaceae bacterium]
MKAIRKLGILLISVCMLLGMMPASLLAEADTAGQADYTVEWVSSSKIRISYNATKAGYVNYIVKEAGSEEPSQEEVLKANDYFPSVWPAKSDSKEVSVETSSAKDVYIVFHQGTAASRIYYKKTKISLPAYSSESTQIKGEASEAGSVAFTAVRKGIDKITLSFTPTVDGTLYYMVKSKNAQAPSAAELKKADSAAGKAGTTSSIDIQAGSRDKKVYVLYESQNGTSIGMGETAVPAGPYRAEAEPTKVSLGKVLDDYTPDSVSGSTVITNTGEETLSFRVDESAEGYSAFSEYFTVDTSEVQDLKAGEKGTVTIRPKEGLAPGKTYTASFSLVDDMGENGRLTLGPVTVSISVVKKGDSMPEGIRRPEGKYTPSSENVSGGSNTTDTNRIMMDGKVVYCVNYYFNLSNQSDFLMNKIYGNKFSKLANVTAQEMDAYTGLNLNREKLYPPNDRGFTPVKNGDPNSKTLENVRKVLYNGYGSDAANIKGKYGFSLLMDTRKDYAFEVATQCAIWHYTDTDENGNTLTFDKLKGHIKD